MPVVAVLCGGKGTRIATIAGDLPKALLPVAGKPFLDHQLTWLHEGGVRDVVLLTGYRGDRIRAHAGDGARFGLSIAYCDDGAEPRGTGGALVRALPLLGETFVCVYGDALLQAEPLEIASALDDTDEGVMSVYRNEDRWVRSNVALDGDRVGAYDKNAPPGTFAYLDYGINVFRARAFDDAPRDRAFDLADVHRALIARRTLRGHPVGERFYEIGTPEGLAETEAFLRYRTTVPGAVPR